MEVPIEERIFIFYRLKQEIDETELDKKLKNFKQFGGKQNAEQSLLCVEYPIKLAIEFAKYYANKEDTDFMEMFLDLVFVLLPPEGSEYPLPEMERIRNVAYQNKLQRHLKNAYEAAMWTEAEEGIEGPIREAEAEAAKLGVKILPFLVRREGIGLSGGEIRQIAFHSDHHNPPAKVNLIDVIYQI